MMIVVVVVVVSCLSCHLDRSLRTKRFDWEELRVIVVTVREVRGPNEDT